MNKKTNSTYLVAMWLKTHKNSYIHDLKRDCKCNNPMQRIKRLKDAHGWQIITVYEGMINKVAVYHYEVIKEGKMPEKYV